MNELPRTLASSGGATVDRLEIGGLTIDLRREELRDTEGRRIDLRNRSFGVLRHLATNAGRVVTKDELLGANWPGVTVTEDSLTQCISEIRRALGDAGRDLIRTVPRRGYMVVLPERTEAEADLPVAAKPRKSAWYRNPRTVAPALFGAALLAVWGAWTLTRGTGLPPTSLPAPTMASSGPTVAVLPFENATADSGQDARADGLTQAMISALSRFGELRVLTRGATSAYKGGRTNVVELRRALGVDYAVDGSLLRDGDLVRIDIRLSDARTGAQVWSRTFKTPGDAADRLASQDDISDQASAMIASYWGAIGVAEYKRIQDQIERGTETVRMHRARRGRNVDERVRSGAGPAGTGLSGNLDAQRAEKRRGVGGPHSRLRCPAKLGLRFAGRGGRSSRQAALPRRQGRRRRRPCHRSRR